MILFTCFTKEALELAFIDASACLDLPISISFQLWHVYRFSHLTLISATLGANSPLAPLHHASSYSLLFWANVAMTQAFHSASSWCALHISSVWSATARSISSCCQALISLRYWSCHCFRLTNGQKALPNIWMYLENVFYLIPAFG